MVEARWVLVVGLLAVSGVATTLACSGDDASGDGGGGGSTSNGTGGASGSGGSSMGTGDSGAGGSSSSGSSGISGSTGGRGGSGTSGGSSGSSGSDDGTGGASSGEAGASSGGEGGKGGDSPSCDLQCEAGEHCELIAVQCIQAPCPAQPECVADQGSGGSGAGGAIDCDPREITCRRAPPECPELQVPSVDGNCFGPCVGIEECPCSGPDECPEHDSYTCHVSAHHCTPYLN